MIAKVRIAPVEQWCEVAKDHREAFPQAGQWIEIETDSMDGVVTEPQCGGHEWTVSMASQRSLNAKGLLRTPPEIARMRICEHRLEMD